MLLLEAGPRILPAFTPDLSTDAQRRLERLGVTVRTGTAVTAIAPGVVEAGGKRIASATVLWAAGVAASPLGADLGVQRDRAGRVPVEADLTVPGHPEIFVVGDLAAVRSGDRPVPGVAPAAKQMGAHAARAIAARLAGRPTPPFRYRDQGALATIGRRAAVVQFRRLKLRGLLAWWFWLAAHVYFLVGFRNRLVVLIDWAWAYWTYQRSARIIVGQEPRGPGGSRADAGPEPSATRPRRRK